MIERIKERAKLVRPLLIPVLLYIGFISYSFNWINENQASPYRVVIALLPMLPGFFVAWGIVNAISKLDEMERKILLEGMAISFAVTLLLMISMGTLGLAGFQQLNGTYIALLMLVLWLIGKLWGHRRVQ